MKISTPILGISLLVLQAACGGGGGGSTPSGNAGAPASSTVTPATPIALAYQDPSSTGFRLVKNAASTSTHLVLDLLGPAGGLSKGVALFLETDAAKVTWVHPTGVTGSHVAAGTVFPLGAAPQMLVDKVQAEQLQVGLFQKGGSATVIAAAPLLSLALDLNSASVAKGAVHLAIPTGKQPVMVNADGTVGAIEIQVGQLSVQ